MQQSPWKKLLDQVRGTLRLKHYSRRTEESYVNWLRRCSSSTISVNPSTWAHSIHQVTTCTCDQHIYGVAVYNADYWCQYYSSTRSLRPCGADPSLPCRLRGRHR